MTDITINIKTGSENNEPKVTTNTDNLKTVVPKTETPMAETPKAEIPKEAITSEKESPKKNDSNKMDMSEEEHAKINQPKTKTAEETSPKKEVAYPKKELHKKE
ncbi:MAG: hypothetical protein ABIO98_02700 [Chitinophagales bacterium]